MAGFPLAPESGLSILSHRVLWTFGQFQALEARAMAPVEASDGDLWIGRPEAMRRLAAGERALETLVESGKLTCRHVPGSIRRYLASEVDALAAESTIPSGSRPV